MDNAARPAMALIDAVRERAASDDPLVLLATAVTVAAETHDATDALVEHFVAAARVAGLSWTAIGDRLGVSKQAARQRYADRLGQADIPVDAEGVAISPRLAACLQAAQDAADTDDSVPGTHHLLLGLLHTGYAAAVLDQLGVTRDGIRATAARLFAQISTTDGTRVLGDGEAESAVAQARRFTAGRGQSRVDTQQLLLVIATDPGSAARRVLNDLGVHPDRIKKELADMIPPPIRGRGKRVRGRVCAFCGCTNPDRPMVAGPSVWICSACVHLSLEILSTGDRALRSTRPA
ncbi:Clp protease N-terminal domain-containing protein [Hamadaea sp. NPDC050747]|uniref:ClpX C4-type zinc finger protein n=1 Tax=Hamadaea sp. NPDC050747 TaxID=3155789 RepID=UPI0033F2DFE6